MAGVKPQSYQPEVAARLERWPAHILLAHYFTTNSTTAKLGHCLDTV